MRLLFIGLSPEPALKRLLSVHNIVVKTTKHPEEIDQAFDLIALSAKNATVLQDCDDLRRRFPLSWIALVINRKGLKDGDFQDAVLRCASKNDVWLEEDWQYTFWFALQRMFQHHSLVKDLTDLRENYYELSKSSDQLIQQLEKDVGLAASIQRTLLPRVSPAIPGVSIAVRYLPAAGVGGDYYDIFEFGDKKRFGVLIADSKTHGMAAALLSVLLKVRLDEMRERFPDSHSFVDFLNREIRQIDHNKFFSSALSSLSLLYGILDRSELSFKFTSAGSLKPLLWRSGKSVEMPNAQNPPLGEMDHFEFRESRVDLKPGDLLILHTDGLEGPMTQKHSSSLDGIAEVLQQGSHSPHPQEVQNELMALVDAYLEKQPLSDDLTLIHFAIDERALYSLSRDRLA